MSAYYNELDPYAAQWLRNLIAAGHIADGVVDNRSISEIEPNELREFTQCHFFAGIGVWSLALRLAGWPDERPVWTGSCPCQPFSAAGKSGGFDDERHLWPHWHHLIRECRPPVLFGEQVASKDGLGWLDLVYADLEGEGYAVGAFDLCAAGVGAPHIRQRLWIVGEDRLAHPGSTGQSKQCQNNDSGREVERQRAHGELPHVAGRWPAGSVGNPHDAGLEGLWGGHSPTGRQRQGAVRSTAEASELGGLGHSAHQPCERGTGSLFGEETPQHGAGFAEHGAIDQRPEYASEGLAPLPAERCGSGLADAERDGSHRTAGDAPEQSGDGADDRLSLGSGEDVCGTNRRIGGLADTEHDDGRADESRREPQGRTADGRDSSGSCGSSAAGPTNGHWGVADWLFCRDGKWRAVRPGSFPLVDGSAGRVGRLRAYGNAIVPQVAAEVIATYLEARP